MLNEFRDVLDTGDDASDALAAVPSSDNESDGNGGTRALPDPGDELICDECMSVDEARRNA